MQNISMNRTWRALSWCAASGLGGCAAQVDPPAPADEKVATTDQALSTPYSAEFVSLQVQDLAVVRADADYGRMYVVARDIYNRVYYEQQVSANGGWYPYWQVVNGYASGGMYFTMTSAPAAIARLDGSIELAGRGPNGELCTTYQYKFDNTPWNFSTWSCSMGPYGGPISEPALVRNKDGRITVFVIGQDGQLWYRTQYRAYEHNSDGWMNWEYFGGSPTSKATLLQDAWGRVQVYYRNGSGAVEHQFQCTPNADCWSLPDVLGGSIQGAPVVGNNADGRMEAFMIGPDGAIWQNWQTLAYPFGYWSGWYKMRDSPSTFSKLAIGYNASSGRQEVFGYNYAWGYIMSLAQVVPNGGWGTWNWLMDTAYNAPAVGTNADGRLEVFAVEGGPRIVEHRWQVSPGYWSPPPTPPIW